MQRDRLLPGTRNGATVLAMLLALVTVAAAQPKYKILHAFGAGNDGGGLYGGLALDGQGNLYGGTSGGGTYRYGIVFELSPKSNGQWDEVILHSFPSFYDDGETVWGGHLVVDAAGNLYGTTVSGGTHASGIAFELAHASRDETVLYNFCSKPDCSDGGSASAGLIADHAGNFYGTGGVIFELSPGSDGWDDTVLHDFTCSEHGACEPYGLVMDSSGNLYGVTTSGGGGRCSCGTAYELSPTGGGNWKEYTLHHFGARSGDGEFAGGVLVVGTSGALYGETGGGGATGYGTVYRLMPKAGGHWEETIIHNFANDAGGSGPGAGLVVDKFGNLYGVTGSGGDPNCFCGVVFKLAPAKKGKWTYTVLHRFTGYDGAQPGAQLIFDDKGNLYGTTITGGPNGYGVAFELTP